MTRKIDKEPNNIPTPLLLSGRELDNIQKGGKIFLISLAAGSGHKTMAATVKKLLIERYHPVVTEKTFFDPFNSAEGHPGVWLWNRWQNSESVPGLMFLVNSQGPSDWFHYPFVRLGLPRILKAEKAVKVIDVQTNMTGSSCLAVADYNALLAGRTESIPMSIRFVYGLLDYDYRLDKLFWVGQKDSFLKKLFASVLYLPCYAVSITLGAILGVINLGRMLISAVFFRQTKQSTKPDFFLRGPVKTVKVLTDVPVYDKKNKAYSTINYFNSLSVLPKKTAQLSHLSIVSPPAITPKGSDGPKVAEVDSAASAWRECDDFFDNPFPADLRQCVHFTSVEDTMVRQAFKLSKAELHKAIMCDDQAKSLGYVVESEKVPGKKTSKVMLSRDPDTLYLSVMLGGNGGDALAKYAKEVEQMVADRLKALGPEASGKVNLTVFCGNSREGQTCAEINEYFSSPAMKEKFPNLAVKALGRVEDKVIAGVISRSHFHITRPGGISTFELSAMHDSGLLDDTHVLFHTPHSEKSKGEVAGCSSGLLPWERSNALWFIAKRYGVPNSVDKVANMLEVIRGHALTPKEKKDLEKYAANKTSILREVLANFLMNECAFRYSSAISHRLAGFDRQGVRDYFKFRSSPDEKKFKNVRRIGRKPIEAKGLRMRTQMKQSRQEADARQARRKKAFRGQRRT